VLPVEVAHHDKVGCLQPAARGTTQSLLRQALPVLGRKILRILPGEETAMRRILSLCLLWAMIATAGAILLPLIMAFALK
jgi:hypothetical protein